LGVRAFTVVALKLFFFPICKENLFKKKKKNYKNEPTVAYIKREREKKKKKKKDILDQYAEVLFH